MAYTVSNNYKNVIYSGDSKHKIKILFNNVELQEADRYCERATIKSRIIPNGAKRFSLNNFISKEVEIILHDIDTSIIQDKVSISIGTLVGNAYEYVPIGIFNIQGTPTTDKNKITIKLRDNSVKFDFNYNAKPLIDEKGGSATKLQILQDICSKANVTCNISSFIGSTDSIGIYDNTITARQYIADIAEQAGKIATINRNGELIFVDLNNLTTWNIPLSIVEKYEIGKSYKIGKVVYEDAIRKYETASTNYDTLYLDASNPYISSQSQVNSILQQVNNFIIDSVKTGKILGNPAIDSYDLINVYDDKVQSNPSIFKTLATSDLVYNGVLISTYDTQIGEEERKENVSIVGEATFKKWATTNINNINGEIDIQAGKIDNVEKEINPTQDASGSSIYLEDSTNAELVNFEMEGKTTQETREGTNYFDATKITSTSISVSEDGKEIVMPVATSGNGLYGTGSDLSDLAPNLKVGDTVYLYFDRSSEAYNKYIYLYGSEFLWIKGNARTITQEDLDGRVGLYANRYISGETEQITISNLRIVKEQNTEWEQYGAMPSPDYPSELVSVGYENKFNIEITPSWVGGNTTYELNNNILKVTGLWYVGILIDVEANTDYYVNATRNIITSVSATGKINIYNASKTFIKTIGLQDGTFNSGNNTQVYVVFYAGEGSSGSCDFSDIIVAKGTQAHSYIPYGKYGIEVISQGANYFDASKITNTSITVEDKGKNIVMPVATSGNGSVGAGASLKTLAPNLKVGDTVYLYFDRIGNYNQYIYLVQSNYLWNKGTALTITEEYLNSGVTLYANRFVNGETQQITLTNFRIVKEENTAWEEYKSKTYLYTLNQPLRSIGDTKDLLYIKNGMLYVDRKIGSVVLDGSESGWYIGNSGNTGNIKRFVLSLSASLPNQSYDLKSNYFVGGMPYSSNVEGVNINSSSLLSIYKDENDLASFKTWLSTHNTEVQYILAEPNTEGLGKIEVPITYKTITHINTTDELEPNMNITYVRDTQLTNYVEEHISQIIVNEEGISSRVQTIEDSDYDSRLNAVEQKQTATDLTIDIISTNIDKTNGEVRAVTTDTGFTFNENGLNIKKSDTDYNTLIDNTGTYYKDGETIISMTNKDGFLAKDFRLQGQHYYSYNATNPSEPLASENYDFVDERIEVEVDGQTQYAYATFYNGEV